MTQLKNILEAGIVFHQSNEFEKAIAVYMDALLLYPASCDAHNLLSNAYANLGNYNLALFHANEAIDLAHNPEFFNNRGLLFIQTKKFFEAETDLIKAVKLNPNMAEAYNNLCIVYRLTKKYKKSRDAGLKAIELRSDFSEAKASMGALMLDMQDFIAAEEYLESSINDLPGFPLAEQNLSKVKYKLNKFQDSLDLYLRVEKLGLTDLEGDFAAVHSLLELGNTEAATDLLLKIFSKNKHFLEGLDSVLKQDVFFGVLYKCMQYVCSVRHQHNIAENIYQIAIDNAPIVAHALWVNLGSLYFSLNRLPESINANKRAIECNANQLWAYNNLGVCYMGQGDSIRAIECFNKTLELDPYHASALGWLLKEKCHICDWTDFDEIRQRVDQLRQTINPAPISAFTALAVYDDPEALLFWARVSANEIFNESIKAAISLINRPLRSVDYNTQKIRVGYFSFDFRNHPVAHLTARLFELHDRSKFEVYAYSYGPDDGSSVRKRIQSSVDHFRELNDMPSVKMGQIIADDKIDFLIDLTGNTQHNRSEVFALRPARVQAHWLGFIGTMGSKYYDYIIADDVVVPPGAESYFEEAILRIPSGFHVSDDTRLVDHLAPTRSQYGLPEAAFVFGSFCQTFKIQPEMYEAWLTILMQIPQSVLWLASGPDGAFDNLKVYATAKGVNPDRIIVAERCGVDEYLSRYQLIDLFLDTFPYTSGTVASDALRSGCPLLTCSGRTMVSRMAGSILAHADMPQLIAHNYEEYIAKAVNLASNPQELNQIRMLLKNNTKLGKLLNTKKFVAELEASIINVVS